MIYFVKAQVYELPCLYYYKIKVHKYCITIVVKLGYSI